MCTFNGAAYLPAQLESIALQTLPPHELIICDDGSTDSTQAIVKDFAAQASMPVSLHVNARTLGVKKNFEQAIALCSGDVIALCDQDDVWHLEKLQRFENTLTREPTTGLVFSDAEIVDADLNSSGRTMWQALGFDRQKRRSIELGRFELLVPGWTVTGATMAFRSRYRKLCLPIPAELQMLHDGWIALTIASVAKVIPLDESLIRYRTHSNQQVGPPKQRPRRNSRGTALRHQSSNAELLQTLSTLQERLEIDKESFDCSKALQRIRGYQQHLNARASLCPAKFSRLPAIMRELTSLRYHHYSKGFRSAAKDFLFLSLRSPET